MNTGENMKHKIKNIINTDLFKSIFINLVIVFLCVVFCDSVFETNDDYGMASITYGYISGYSNSHLIFSNILLGKGLTILMSLFPEIPWYGVSQYIVVLFSFGIITYVLLKRENKWCGYFLTAIVLSFSAYEFYVKLQFTKTAGIASIAGILLLFYTIQLHINYKRNIVIGIIMVIIGSWYRFEACLLSLLVFSTLGVIVIINNIKKKKLNIQEYILIFGVTIILIFVFKMLDSKVYERNQDWREFKEYNEKRANLLDYGFPDYVEFQEEYKELGISENDFNMFRSWTFADPEVFNTELMDKLISLKSSKEIDFKFGADFFDLFPYAFLKEKLFLASMILFIIWFLDKNRETYIIPYAVVLIFSYNFFLFYKGRYLQHRVDVVLWMAFLCLFGYLIKDLHLINRKECGRYVTALYFIIFLFTIEPYLTSIKTKDNTTNEMNKSKQMCEMIGNNKDRLYFTIASDNRLVCYRPYDSMQKGLHSNVYALGGWGIQMPLTNQILENYNVYNPFRDIVNNPAFYLMTEEVQLKRIVTYIQEHYDDQAYAVLVKSYDGYNFYKIISGSVNVDVSDATKFNDTIVSDYEMTVKKDIVNFKGKIYSKKTKSFEDELLLRVIYKNPEKQTLFYVPQYVNSNSEDSDNCKYPEFDYNIQLTDYKDVKLELILNTNHEIYIDKVKK